MALSTTMLTATDTQVTRPLDQDSSTAIMHAGNDIENCKIRITSYNCYSLKSKVDIIRDLLLNCDVLCCQEVILLESELNFVESIDENFQPI